MRLLALLFFVCGCIRGMSSDVFPAFETDSFDFMVPTNTPGCLKDMNNAVGANYVYHLNGQRVSGNEGHIQTLAEGFSGKTDESTPWKTLTELLALYQKGGSKQEMIALYDNDSVSFIEMVYGDKMRASFQASCRSIQKMSVVLGFDCSGYYLAFVRTSYSGGRQNVIPFAFTNNHGKYKVSAPHFTNPPAVFLNVGACLNNARTSNNK